MITITLAKGDGRIAARMKSLTRVDLLILDDLGLEPLDGNARHHLLETLEDRCGRRSTLVTSQLPGARWYQVINDTTTPTPYSTASSTTPTGSNSTVNPCAGRSLSTLDRQRNSNEIHSAI